MFCVNCGKEITADEKFCANCGAEQSGAAPAEPAVTTAPTPSPVPPAPAKKGGGKMIAVLAVIAVAIAAAVFILGGKDDEKTGSGDVFLSRDPTEKELEELDVYLVQQAAGITEALGDKMSRDYISVFVEDEEIIDRCAAGAKLARRGNYVSAVVYRSSREALATVVTYCATSYGVKATVASSILSDSGAMKAPGALQEDTALVLLNCGGAGSFVSFWINDDGILVWSAGIAPVEMDMTLAESIIHVYAGRCDERDYDDDELEEILEKKVSPKMRSVIKPKTRGNDFVLETAFELLDEMEDRAKEILVAGNAPMETMSYIEDVIVTSSDADFDEAVLWENIEITEKSMDELMELMGGAAERDLSDSEQEQLREKLIPAIPNMITGNYMGDMYLAAYSMCTTSVVYAEPKNMPGDCMLWLETGGDTAFCVSFVSLGDGYGKATIMPTMSAYNGFMGDEISEAMEDIYETETFFSESDIEKWQ